MFTKFYNAKIPFRIMKNYHFNAQTIFLILRYFIPYRKIYTLSI